jgi:hypothetical protein
MLLGSLRRVALAASLVTVCPLAFVVLASPAAAAAGVSWSKPQLIDPGKTTYGVSCPTTTLCVAIDEAGTVVTTSNPASHPWHVTKIDQQSPASLGCAHGSPTVCVVGDGIFNLVTSSNPLSGPWNINTSTENNLNSHASAISCSKTTFCVVGGSRGDLIVSTTPTTAWPPTSTTDNGNYITSVDCTPGTTFCAAFDDAGNMLTNADASNAIDQPGDLGTWTSKTIDAPPADAIVWGGYVSCPKTSLCVMADEAGNVFTSTNPTGGGATWKETTGVDPGGQFASISCAAGTSFCVAVGKTVAAWSSNPTGGKSAWSKATVDPAGSLFSVSCPSSKLCVAVDQTGHALLATPGVTKPPKPAKLKIISAKVNGTTCKLKLSVPGAGKVTISGSGFTVTTKAKVAETVNLTIHHPRAKVKITVTFKPTHGATQHASKTVTFA